MSGPHSGMKCTECHETIETLPHEKDLESVNCSSCHDDVREQVDGSIHAKIHPKNLPDTQNCSACHDPHRTEWTRGNDSRETGEIAIRICLKCHGESSLGHTSMDRRFTTGAAFLRSVHFHELQTGNPEAPSCIDCHGSHGTLPRSDPESSVHPSHTTQTCGHCHSDIAETFKESVHGQSLQNGYIEAPECTSCHNTHDIPSATASNSMTSRSQVSALCSSCHSSPVLIEKFPHLSAEHVATFWQSIHGLAGTMGNSEAANCTSCHGIHNIFPSSEIRSTVHPFHVLETCQQCHPNAGPNFVDGDVHVSIGATVTPVKFTVRTVYLTLIALTLGFMILHNGLVIFRHVSDRLRTHSRVPTVKRFKRIHLIQHHLIALAFIILAITGFALKYPDSQLTGALTQMGMTEAIRSILHRVAAASAMTLFASHLAGLVLTKGGRIELANLMLRWKDLRDFIMNVSYNLGRSEAIPHYDRFTYWEKIEYWALIWGMIVMTLTGLALWFPEIASWVLPRRLLTLAEAVHFYEASLAVGAIFCWHLFFAVYHPKEYPLSTAMLTGEITLSHMKEIHGMEYQRMRSEQMKNLRIHPSEDLQVPQEI